MQEGRDGPAVGNTADSAIITSDTSAGGTCVLDAAARRRFVDKDPQQCSYLSQLYASADVTRHLPGGEANKFLVDAKKTGSLWKWSYSPTWTGPACGTTQDVSSVAVVVSQTPAQAPAL